MAGVICEYDWQAIATVVAGALAFGGALYAANAAKEVSLKIGTKQIAIQQALADIERTKIDLELIDKRSSLISAAHELLAFNSIETEEVIFELHDKATQELSSQQNINKYCFNSSAENCFNLISRYLVYAQYYNIKIYNKDYGIETKILKTQMKDMAPIIQKEIAVNLHPQIYLFRDKPK